MEELQVEAEKLLAAVLEPVCEGVKKLKRGATERKIEAEEEKVGKYLAALSELWSTKRHEFERLSKW